MKLAFALFLALFSLSAHADHAANWGANPAFINNQSVINITTTDTQIIAANPYRAFLQIANDSASIVIIKFGGSTVSGGMSIQASTIYSPVLPSADSIWAHSSAGVIPIVILEGIQ